jgi:hypothetical protein
MPGPAALSVKIEAINDCIYYCCTTVIIIAFPKFHISHNHFSIFHPPHSVHYTSHPVAKPKTSPDKLFPIPYPLYNTNANPSTPKAPITDAVNPVGCAATANPFDVDVAPALPPVLPPVPVPVPVALLPVLVVVLS